MNDQIKVTKPSSETMRKMIERIKALETEKQTVKTVITEERFIREAIQEARDNDTRK